MDVREKLVEILRKPIFPHELVDPIEAVADYLLDSGVTVQEWISVDDRLPENDVMVIGYTPCDGFMFVGYYHEEPKYDWKVWRIVTAMRSTKVMTKKGYTLDAPAPTAERRMIMKDTELYVNANDVPLGKFPEPRTEWHQGWNDALDAVKESAQNVNFIRIVRCSKCKYYEIEQDDFLGLCKCEQLAKSNGSEIYPERDFFCAYGEEKE